MSGTFPTANTPGSGAAGLLVVIGAFVLAGGAVLVLGLAAGRGIGWMNQADQRSDQFDPMTGKQTWGPPPARRPPEPSHQRHQTTQNEKPDSGSKMS